jgi:hypothetical protein
MCIGGRCVERRARVGSADLTQQQARCRSGQLQARDHMLVRKLAFIATYNQTAKTFKWNYTRKTLES